MIKNYNMYTEKEFDFSVFNVSTQNRKAFNSIHREKKIELNYLSTIELLSIVDKLIKKELELIQEREKQEISFYSKQKLTLTHENLIFSNQKIFMDEHEFRFEYEAYKKDKDCYPITINITLVNNYYFEKKDFTEISQLISYLGVNKWTNSYIYSMSENIEKRIEKLHWQKNKYNDYLYYDYNDSNNIDLITTKWHCPNDTSILLTHDGAVELITLTANLIQYYRNSRDYNNDNTDCKIKSPMYHVLKSLCNLFLIYDYSDMDKFPLISLFDRLTGLEDYCNTNKLHTNILKKNMNSIIEFYKKNIWDLYPMETRNIDPESKYWKSATRENIKYR